SGTSDYGREYPTSILTNKITKVKSFTRNILNSQRVLSKAPINKLHLCPSIENVIPLDFEKEFFENRKVKVQFYTDTKFENEIRINGSFPIAEADPKTFKRKESNPRIKKPGRGNMCDEEEIVGSDFIGSDDEEKSVEALELKLQKILQEKEKLEKQKKKDELLSKIKQAEAALSNLQTSAEPSKSEIDAWTTVEIKQFFRRKGIIVKNKPLDHIRKLAKSVIDSRIPDHTTTAPSEISKRTINKNGIDLAFPYIKDKSLSNWSDDLSSLPSVEHVQAHAYIISSAEFDLDRFQNIQKEDSFLLYKGNAIKKIEIHKLDEGFCYVTCNCMSSQNSQTHIEVVWSLLRNDGCIQAAGCSCDEGSDCCKHSIALLLTLASLNKSNNYAVD
ncbi:hypothetical protein AM593_09598, partial [Mytilus galloprovincialis]